MSKKMTKHEMAWYLVDALYPANEGRSRRKKNEVVLYMKQPKKDLEGILHLAEAVHKSRSGKEGSAIKLSYKEKLNHAVLLLRNLARKIETCYKCEGTGESRIMPQEACAICGGQGVVLEATGVISEIRYVLEIIHDRKL